MKLHDLIRLLNAIPDDCYFHEVMYRHGDTYANVTVITVDPPNRGPDLCAAVVLSKDFDAVFPPSGALVELPRDPRD